MQDGEVAGEREVELVRAVAADVGKGEIVCRRGVGLHHVVKVHEQVGGFAELVQLHGSCALDHGHEDAGGDSMAGYVGDVRVPASLAAQDIEEVTSDFATGDGGAEQFDRTDGVMPRRHESAM